MVHLLAGIAWDPQIRGFLAVARRRRRADGLGVPAARHQPRRPGSASSSPSAPSSAGARSWASPGGCTAPSACSARRPLGGRRRSSTERDHRRPACRRRPRGGPRARHLRACPRPRSSTSSTRSEFDGDARRGRADASAAGGSCPSPNPSFGEAKATVDEHFAEHPDEELGLEGAADYITVYSFETRRQGRACPTTRAAIDRITTQAQDHVLAAPAPAPLRHHPGAAGDRAGGRAGRGAAHPRGRPGPSRSCRVIMERDLGDVRLPGRHAHDLLRAHVRA